MNKFLLAIILMVSSLIGVFATGLQFDLFGSPINLLERPVTLLFYAFIFLGIFGVFFLIFSLKRALIGLAIVVLIYGGLFVLGKIIRG
ncbi:TPA: hypothetical protein RQK83_004206 [Vibrio vulnificus]|nr:hypothetical protein [Vibrio vulnificus]HDY8057700.1 hypothetical protein [Vibrio vulnificus]